VPERSERGTGWEDRRCETGDAAAGEAETGFREVDMAGSVTSFEDQPEQGGRARVGRELRAVLRRPLMGFELASPTTPFGSGVLRGGQAQRRERGPWNALTFEGD
jgi:hypothetical protein